MALYASILCVKVTCLRSVLAAFGFRSDGVSTSYCLENCQLKLDKVKTVFVQFFKNKQKKNISLQHTVHLEDVLVS